MLKASRSAAALNPTYTATAAITGARFLMLLVLVLAGANPRRRPAFAKQARKMSRFGGDAKLTEDFAAVFQRSELLQLALIQTMLPDWGPRDP